MKTDEKDILLIEDYLAGKLNKVEYESFQQRVETDADFASLLKIRMNLEPEYRKARAYEELKKEVGQVMKKESSRVIGLDPAWVFAIAASVVLLIGLYIVFLAKSSVNTPDQMPLVEGGDSTEMLQIDEPESYAKMDVLSIEIVEPKISQSFGVKDSIPFRWVSESNLETDLVIMNEADKIVLVKKRIDLTDSVYFLSAGILPQGTYAWYINDSETGGVFVVQK